VTGIFFDAAVPAGIRKAAPALKKAAVLGLGVRNAKKPVMTIKPLAAGRILPVVGLAFVWNTIRDQDMVTIGTTTPDEAREVIELSLDLLNRRLPENKLQETRSKKSLH